MGVDSTTRITQSHSAAARAEKEAAERIHSARKRARDTELELQKETEKQILAHEQQMDVERTRAEAQLQSQQLKNYEQLLEMRRQAHAEIQRAQREADRNLEQIQEVYERSKANTESRGEKALRENEFRNATQLEYQRKQGAHQIQSLREEQNQMRNQLHQEQTSLQESLSNQLKNKKEELATQTQSATEEAQEHYNRLFQSRVQNHQETINELNRKTNLEIQNIRQDTAHQLNAYQSRQVDPFYKLVQMNADLEETDRAFVLRAKIPEHEQKGIQIQMRGNTLVLSGQRRNEEVLEIAPGHSQKTYSYQTYQETFPLNWPINAKHMVKEFKGDELVVILPKLNYTDSQINTRKKGRVVEPALAERPQFPPNLPGEKELAELPHPNPRGRRTLS